MLVFRSKSDFLSKNRKYATSKNVVRITLAQFSLELQHFYDFDQFFTFPSSSPYSDVFIFAFFRPIIPKYIFKFPILSILFVFYIIILTHLSQNLMRCSTSIAKSNAFHFIQQNQRFSKQHLSSTAYFLPILIILDLSIVTFAMSTDIYYA